LPQYSFLGAEVPLLADSACGILHADNSALLRLRLDLILEALTIVNQHLDALL
jgi:hypothetical protein